MWPDTRHFLLYAVHVTHMFEKCVAVFPIHTFLKLKMFLTAVPKNYTKRLRTSVI